MRPYEPMLLLALAYFALPSPYAVAQEASVSNRSSDTTSVTASQSVAADTEEDSAAKAEAQSGAVIPHRAESLRARNHLTPQQTLDRHVRLLTQALNLDAVQQSKLREILENERRQFIALRSGGAETRSDMSGTLRSILDQTREQIRGMLTDEQKKNYPQPVPQDLTAPAQADLDHWLKMMQQPQKSSKDEN